MTLEWSHVDLDRGFLLLPDSKIGRKTIVLNSAALDLLRTAPRDSRFVVPGAATSSRFYGSTSSPMS